MFSNFFTFPLFLAALLFFIGGILSKEKVLSSPIPRPFDNEFSNQLYALSYNSFFNLFIVKNTEDKEVVNINRLIAESGFSHLINYEAFAVLRASSLIIGIIFILISFVWIDGYYLILEFLFNISMQVEGVNTDSQVQMFTIALAIVLYFLPEFVLKKIAKQKSKDFQQNLPLLQLFIIQMLKGNNPISKVIYLMGKIETPYKRIFAVAFRIYSRSPEDGLNYLKNAFKGTKFEETIGVLQDYSKYSQSSSIKTLEHIKRDIEGNLTVKKKTGSASALLASQAAVGVPFISLILLGLVPLIMLGSDLMSQAQFTM